MDQIRFIKQTISIKPDIVHINPSLDIKSFIRDGLFVLWAKKRNIPVVVFFHGWQKKFEKQIDGVLKGFLSLTYMKADLFIVLASEFKRSLISWKINKPVHLLTTAVDESLIKNFLIESKMERIKKAKTIRLLFLSRLEKKKGIFETIDAFRILLEDGCDITLSIAGDGSITNEVNDYIKDLGLDKKINVLGYVKGKEKIEALNKHDIYCFPTYYGEGMPTSVIESMAFGMPVITRPVGGIKDFFKNGKMGYLSESTKPSEIAECIREIVADKNMLCDIARFNYNYAKQNFMASKVADNLINIYSSIKISTYNND